MEREQGQPKKVRLTVAERIAMLDKMIKDRERDIEILRQWRRQLVECLDE